MPIKDDSKLFNKGMIPPVDDMKPKEKCPTCGTDCNTSWSGLELVENTGDETLASKVYTPIAAAGNIDEVDELRNRVKELEHIISKYFEPI